MNSVSIFSLEGRVALVSGGAMGLGGAMAKGLGGAGAEVIVVDRDGAGAVATAAAIVADGGKAVSFEAGLADLASIDRLFAFVTERYPRLHVLINNAGCPQRPRPSCRRSKSGSVSSGSTSPPAWSWRSAPFRCSRQAETAVSSTSVPFQASPPWAAARWLTA